MFPLFAPDGANILGCQKGQSDNLDLMVWPAAGGAGRRVGSWSKDPPEIPLWPEVWSPDGTAVATSYVTRENNEATLLRVRILPIDGGACVESRAPCESPLSLLVFAWPGGKEGILALGMPHQTHTTPYQIVRIDPATGASELLGGLHGCSYVSGAALSPDGGTIAYLAAGNGDSTPSLRLRSVADGKERIVFPSLEDAIEYLEGMSSEVGSATRSEKAAGFELLCDAALADVEEALVRYPRHSRLIEIQNDILNLHPEK